MIKIPHFIKVNRTLIGRELTDVWVIIWYCWFLPGKNIRKTLCKIFLRFQSCILFPTDSVLSERSKANITFIVNLIQLFSASLPIEDYLLLKAICPTIGVQALNILFFSRQHSSVTCDVALLKT